MANYHQPPPHAAASEADRLRMWGEYYARMRAAGHPVPLHHGQPAPAHGQFYHQQQQQQQQYPAGYVHHQQRAVAWATAANQPLPSAPHQHYQQTHAQYQPAHGVSKSAAALQNMQAEARRKAEALWDGLCWPGDIDAFHTLMRRAVTALKRNHDYALQKS